MKKCFFVTVFFIVSLFFLHSTSLYNDDESGEYSPYSYTLFSSEETNEAAFSPFSSEEKHSYPDYDLISYNSYPDEEERRMIDRDLPPGFEGNDGLGTEVLPVGNLLPLLFFSGIYVCRIVLKKKKLNKNLLHN